MMLEDRYYESLLSLLYIKWLIGAVEFPLLATQAIFFISLIQ